MELTEWMAYYQVEPFGQDTQYLGHAITSSVIANANRGKSSKAFKPEDFMPKFDRPPQGIGEQMMIAEMFTAALSAQEGE